MLTNKMSILLCSKRKLCTKITEYFTSILELQATFCALFASQCFNATYISTPKLSVISLVLPALAVLLLLVIVCCVVCYDEL